MKITPTQIEHILTLLTQTPPQLTAITATLNHAQLYHQPDKKTWSVNHILAHLRACADVWGDTIQAMLAQDGPTLRYRSPRTWLKKTDYLHQPFAESLIIFTTQRTELLNRLNALNIIGWSRGASIKDRNHTIFSQAKRMALHEERHLVQLKELVEQLI